MFRVLELAEGKDKGKDKEKRQRDAGGTMAGPIYCELLTVDC